MGESIIVIIFVFNTGTLCLHQTFVLDTGTNSGGIFWFLFWCLVFVSKNPDKEKFAFPLIFTTWKALGH